MKQTLQEWAGAARITLTVAFTDMLGSTALGNRLGSRDLVNVRDTHFQQARGLLERNKGFEVKTIGDAFMVVFRTALSASDFALSLHDFTGHEFIRIRAGIHVGTVQIVDDDVIGPAVNYAARLVSLFKDDWIVVSDRAKHDVEDELGSDPQRFSFAQFVTPLKDFPEKQTVWRIQYREAFSTLPITTENLSSYLQNKFPDRQQATVAVVDELIRELTPAGYVTLGDIELARDKGWNAFLAYEPRRDVGNDLIIRPSNIDHRLSDVAAIRSLLYIVDEDFRASSSQYFSNSQLARINEARGLLRD